MGVAVLGGVGVRVGTEVLIAVALGVRVGVASGWLPTRTTMWDHEPRLPVVSRSCAVSVVSPGGKALSVLTTRQN